MNVETSKPQLHYSAWSIFFRGLRPVMAFSGPVPAIGQLMRTRVLVTVPRNLFPGPIAVCLPSPARFSADRATVERCNRNVHQLADIGRRIHRIRLNGR